MKKDINHLFTRLALVAGLVLNLAVQATAQTFTALHNFTNATADGNTPFCGLVWSGAALYGTTSSGGSLDNGTVFAINANGSGYTNLYSFTQGTANYDGASPRAGLVFSGTNLYGVATYGGKGSVGALFAVSTDGSFTNLHNFSGAAANPPYTNVDGAYPQARLVLSGNTLYGTAKIGGAADNGAIFAFNLDTGVFTNLHNFTALVAGTNSDGALPSGGLILSGDTLYGTTENGGAAGFGVIFAVNTDGSGFTNLYNFTDGNDGGYPRGGLVLSSNTLYGTAENGGAAGVGAVFAIKTDGTGFTNLYDFTGAEDGYEPMGGLALSGSTLYGTTEFGGSAGYGNIFAINADGSGFTNLYSFTAPDPTTSTNIDGYFPQAVLLVSVNKLYGTAPEGGSANLGTIFSLSLPTPAARPELAITHSGSAVTVYWQDVSSWTLQQNGDLSAASGWSTGGGMTTTNGTNYLTITPPAGNMFFRLSSP